MGYDPKQEDSFSGPLGSYVIPIETRRDSPGGLVSSRGCFLQYVWDFSGIFRFCRVPQRVAGVTLQLIHAYILVYNFNVASYDIIYGSLCLPGTWLYLLFLCRCNAL